MSELYQKLSVTREAIYAAQHSSIMDKADRVNVALGKAIDLIESLTHEVIKLKEGQANAKN